jgi:hypothetical protein
MQNVWERRHMRKWENGIKLDYSGKVKLGDDFRRLEI